jgi:hypothetical protein
MADYSHILSAKLDLFEAVQFVQMEDLSVDSMLSKQVGYFSTITGLKSDVKPVQMDVRE